MDSKVKKPSVFDFLDLNSYLSEYYTYRKSLGSRFSYESWAQELDLRNKSFLRLVTIGKKKISPNLQQKLSEKMFDQPDESEYFYYLVKYSYASSQKDRADFGKKLMTLLKVKTTKENIIENYNDFLSNPWLPRLLTLLTFKDIQPTLTILAKILDKPADLVEEMLNKLNSIGLATSAFVNGELHWQSLGDAFKVPDKLGNEVLLNYHKECLDDAIRAFAAPQELRRYRSLILPMSEEQLKEFYSYLDAFSAEQIHRFSSDSLSGKRLFQANFNIHKVTEPAP